MVGNIEHVYSDGVVGIFIDGLVVHIKFGKKVNPKESASADEVVRIEEHTTVVMPLTGFLQTVGVVQQLIGDDKFVNIVKRLQEADFISKADDSQKESKGKK